MSRKSRASSVAVSFCHVVPPSTVRNTVAPAPLAQATRSLTALTPRSRTFIPLVCMVQFGAANIINVKPEEISSHPTVTEVRHKKAHVHFGFLMCLLYLFVAKIRVAPSH